MGRHGPILTVLIAAGLAGLLLGSLLVSNRAVVVPVVLGAATLLMVTAWLVRRVGDASERRFLTRTISALPATPRKVVCEGIAVTVYLPLVTVSRVVAPFSPSLADTLPLGYYRDKSFRIMRNDALDRFGTPLEQRFSRSEIETMLVEAGMDQIHFSDRAPFWHCLSRRAQPAR